MKKSPLDYLKSRKKFTFTYDERTCKDCVNYRECYFIEDNHLINTSKPICLKDHDVKVYDHAGCNHYEEMAQEQKQREVLDIPFMLERIEQSIKQIETMLKEIKEQKLYLLQGTIKELKK